MSKFIEVQQLIFSVEIELDSFLLPSLSSVLGIVTSGFSGWNEVRLGFEEKTVNYLSTNHAWISIITFGQWNSFGFKIIPKSFSVKVDRDEYNEVDHTDNLLYRLFFEMKDASI